MSEAGMVKTPEAAARLGLSIRTVKTLIASGELRSVKVAGRTGRAWARRVPVAAIEEFIAAREAAGFDAEAETRR